MRRGAAKLHRSMRITTEEPIAPARYRRFGPNAQGASRSRRMPGAFFGCRSPAHSPRPEPCAFFSSERLQHDEKNDQNEDERRHLIDDPVKARCAPPPPWPQPPRLPDQEAMQPRQREHQGELGMQPALRPSPAHRREPKAETP